MSDNPYDYKEWEQFPNYTNKENLQLRIDYLDNLLYMSMSKFGCKDTDVDPWKTLRDELENRRFWKRFEEKLLENPIC